ncbi:uncharacterized protein LOC105160393 isoform X1 [Sesamum indicum]|uniref:Uncharacterized protein LOC105160393 isoform X1 n=1 Tax=Sesamum indicum TaxID=4182 RepID=A0A6I9T6H3_SESIN|nr:uncharacterized protein LOC105160393 isoform X1 [Sesamum indicum]
MSEIYDNWERLLAAVLRREQFRRLCNQHSRNSSISSSSSGFSFSSPLHDIEFLNFSVPGAATSHNSSPQQQTHRQAAFISESVSPETAPINAGPLALFHRLLHVSQTLIYKVVLKVDVHDDREFGKALKTLIFMVLKVDVHDDREFRKALKVVSSFSGLQSANWDSPPEKLTLVGNFDPISMVKKLRKSLRTEIVSVGPGCSLLIGTGRGKSLH